jgi:hypothetical protein
MRSLESAAVRGEGIRDQLTSAGRPRPLAEVASAVREMKLVTVEVNTSVESSAEDASWRGDVNARVCAPVRLLYGTDLSKLEIGSLALSPATGAYLVRIPVPERIATEVCTEQDPEVQVGWMRLRSRAGEYYLGLARRDLYQRACELALSPEDAAMVRRTTREQVEAMVRKIVGAKTPVTVTFVES